VTGVRRSSEPLELIVEATVADLLDGVDNVTAASLEPSGVCVHDGAFYVIFDNVSTIARIDDPSARSPGNRLLSASVAGAGKDTEHITFDPVSGHFFVLSEAVQHRGRLGCIVGDGEVLLLGLCEGNRCKGGTVSTTGFAVEDSGTIYEFARDAEHRVVYATVEGVSWLADDRLVMVSDRAEGNTPARAKERSLHVFRLPAST